MLFKLNSSDQETKLALKGLVQNHSARRVRDIYLGYETDVELEQD